MLFLLCSFIRLTQNINFCVNILQDQPQTPNIQAANQQQEVKEKQHSSRITFSNKNNTRQLLAQFYTKTKRWRQQNTSGFKHSNYIRTKQQLQVATWIYGQTNTWKMKERQRIEKSASSQADSDADDAGLIVIVVVFSVDSFPTMSYLNGLHSCLKKI